MNFRERVKTQHYTKALIEHLVSIVDSKQDITTFQHIYTLIQQQFESILSECINEPQVISYRSSLSLQSLHEYFLRMIRSLQRRHGSDISKFKESFSAASPQLIGILASSPQRVAANSELLLKEVRRLMVYSYSRSIALSLSKVQKRMQGSLEIVFCEGGPLQEGAKLLQELGGRAANRRLIGLSEAAYFMRDIECVVISAEAVCEDASIVGRAGVHAIALLAHEASRPVYVLVPSYKLIKKSFFVQGDIPQVYMQGTATLDFTPAKYITAFCMDTGIFSPHTALAELAKMLG